MGSKKALSSEKIAVFRALHQKAKFSSISPIALESLLTMYGMLLLVWRNIIVVQNFGGPQLLRRNFVVQS